MKTHNFTCVDCCQNKTHVSEHTTGYGIFDGDKVCFSCCGLRDEKYMREYNRSTLYLVKDGSYYYVTNWPSTLKIPVNYPGVSKGRHNIAGVRYDVWFNFDGNRWHGVTYGDFTQVCHVRRLKHKLGS